MSSLSRDVSVSRGKRFATVDAEDFEVVSQYKWHLHGSGYAMTDVAGKQVLMHRMILGATPGNQIVIDHANGNKLDNRRANLRIASATQNMGNRKINRNNTSGFKGVHRRSFGNKPWRAGITVNGKSIWLGDFYDKELAARAYDAAAKKHFGSFAKTNF